MCIFYTQYIYMFQSVTYWAAFLAGFGSFLSPCLLPLVPAYIMYMTGSYDMDDYSQKRKKAFIQTIGFVIGFTAIFLVLGISASAFGQVLAKHKQLLSQISGGFIIVFGLYMIGVIKIKALNKDYRKDRQSKSSTSFLGAIAMGIAFSFGWTPCFGPILAVILASTAAYSQNIWQGISWLFVYALGMAIPFILTSIFIGFFDKHISKINMFSNKLNIIAGIIMIILGTLMLTNQLGKLALLLI